MLMRDAGRILTWIKAPGNQTDAPDSPPACAELSGSAPMAAVMPSMAPDVTPRLRLARDLGLAAVRNEFAAHALRIAGTRMLAASTHVVGTLRGGGRGPEREAKCSGERTGFPRCD